ncbi:S9 family peptidase [Agrococcus casei]|uniref:Acylamino-acid-releasing enzyme n=1 Tax=Agrococcus casei LMG 22410 TaxID=1255656 RepID=A0A1R4FSI1_9MICO|nr:S9 family peptidase [Agrococcus casei]SJM58970.1 Acylamino-acid-releasing enzyme [Agrococcus casei LMG 22410]
MRAEDIEHLVALSAPAVPADASVAIVAAAHPSLDANKSLSRLWRVDLADGSRTPLTRGLGDSAPALSRDESSVLFLREADGKQQVFALPLAGGEAAQVTHVKHGVQSFRLSADGTRLALQVRISEQGRGDSVKGLGPEAQSPRHITTIRYLGNGLGYVDDAHTHVFVQQLDLDAVLSAAPAAESAPRPDGSTPDEVSLDTAVQLTRGSVDYALCDWSAAGILAITDRHESRDDDLRASLVVIDADAPGAEPRDLVGVDANLSIGGAIETDGSVWLLASTVGESGRDFVAQSTSVYVVEDGTARLLTDPDTHDFGDPGSRLVAIDGGVLALRRTRGRVQLVRVTRDSVETLTDSDQEITSAAVAGDTIVASAQTPTSYGELGLVADGAWSPLTDFGAALQATGLVSPTEHDIANRDGGSVHGWVWVPEGPGPHPVLLNIHGGPFAQYGVHVFDEAQIAVEAGYAVVQCNPRGSSGYGREHGAAIKEAMGTVDLTDVLDFLEGALQAHPELDGQRMGVMGGSYGGYLTAWTIAHDHRFTAALVERGYLDPAAFIGTSDIGSFFSEEYTGYDAEHTLTQSPMAVVDQVRTPTLVVHSELDFRCPLEQAQRYYAALRRNGVDAELLVFPGENHELTRGGQPRHRVERFAHVMDWWDRRLPVAGER